MLKCKSGLLFLGECQKIIVFSKYMIKSDIPIVWCFLWNYKDFLLFMKLQLKLMVINVGKKRIQDSMFYFLNLKELIWSYNSTWWPATFTCNSPINIRNNYTDTVMTIVNVTAVNANTINMFLTNGISSAATLTMNNFKLSYVAVLWWCLIT